MAGEHGFLWLEMIPGLNAYPNHVVMAVGVVLVLLVLSLAARAQLRAVMGQPDRGLVPEAQWTFRNFFEVFAEALYRLTENVMGRQAAPQFFPVAGTVFGFVFISNLLGLIPGLLPSTENLNTTLALGLFVFVFYNWAGFRANGLGYLKHFFGPVLWLAPLMLVIELASHFFRPLSLALRLRGNIMGDHIVLGVFSGLVPYILPSIFFGLGVFVAFIQAFVFSLMTMVYVSLSSSHDH